MRISVALAATLALLGGIPAGSSQAQTAPDNYPSKPVTIVQPLAGGGASEIQFRLFLQSILDKTGARFVIDYKGGGGTTIGTAFVAKAPPDGYTLLQVNSAFSIAPSVYPNLPYDNVKDFAPILITTKDAFILVIDPAAPYKSLPEYITHARTHPGELNFGTGGLGGSSHLPGELLHFLTKTKATFIHYKSPPQRLVDMMAGRVQSAVATYGLAIGYIKSGKLRAIGVTSGQRLPNWPDMPTIAEQGVPGYEASAWGGLVAPARTPAPVVARLNSLFTGALRDPAIVKKLEGDGTLIVASTPEQFGQFIVTENERWRRLIKETGLKLEE